MRFLKPMTKCHVSALVVFLLSGPTYSQTNQKAYPERELQVLEVAGHLRFLAADELMGRKTGEPGNRVAARYIAEQFRAFGLQTVPGAEDYFQNIPFVTSTQAPENEIAIFGETHAHGVSMLVRTAAYAQVTAPIIFVDYGEIDKDNAIDDFKGREVAGKIVLAIFGTRGGTPRSHFAASQAKHRFAAEQGAVALIELFQGPMPWARAVGILNRPRTEIASADAPSDHTIPLILLYDEQTSMASQLSAADFEGSATLKIYPEKIASQTSANVIGMIEGTDEDLRDEFLLLTAHYDHLGVASARGAAADSIYNGARDNGMGTVALICAAKSLSAARPARSVLFIALTAEEMGLLGSKYYVEHALIPLQQCVFVLNTDGAGYTDTSIVSVIGLVRTTAQAMIEEGASAFGLQAIGDPVPEMNLFDRSDNVHFARMGVPAPTFSPGFRAFDAELQRYYHQPADEVDDNFDLNYLLKFCQAYTHSARKIANMSERPAWRPGDVYEEAGKELYKTR